MATIKEDRVMTESEIIDKLNELEDDLENMNGSWIIDCVLDDRDEAGLPPFSPEELAQAESECDRIRGIVEGIYGKIDDLRVDYFELTGKWPWYSGVTNRYLKAKEKAREGREEQQEVNNG